MNFELVSDFKPSGDQPAAIAQLLADLEKRKKFNTLLGVTGSGKTYTVANVIQAINKPTLVITHNKTLVAQLYSELKEFFPKNAVEYFVSYYDYYQPEAYVPQTDTFIEKDSAINEDIDRLRLRATSSLLSRRDCIVVASVSCIYGLGTPEDYAKLLILVKRGDALDRDALLKRLVEIQYTRNDVDPKRGTFRVKGDTVDVFLAYEERGVRFQLEFDTVSAIHIIDPLTGDLIQELESAAVYPAKHFVTTEERIEESIKLIDVEVDEQVKRFTAQNKLIEAQRIEQRVKYDIEMMRALGYCSGIENYSRYLSGRAAGSRPYCLLDYFPKDYLLVIDESHATLPQVRGMFNGDQARKQTLVDYGFRLPSALDNRPLRFEEFEKLIPQAIFISATPGPYEIKTSGKMIEQVIRPTGLVDPEVEIRGTKGQIDNLIEEVLRRAEKKEKVLVTTLTKRMSEDLTRFLNDRGLRAKYLHSEIDAIQRVEILRDLRKGEFDVLVGINLLREGLDLPEVSLVAILDADKEGFLRSETSLIQTAGRAARHVNGHVILYADNITDSMRRMMDESTRRRKIQVAYNTEHGITPRGIFKKISEGIEGIKKIREVLSEAAGVDDAKLEKIEIIDELERQMEEASRNLQFEKAILLRDRITEMQKRYFAEAAAAKDGEWKRGDDKPAKKPSKHLQRLKKPSK
jgi:excinuclease ABC subunit B